MRNVTSKVKTSILVTEAGGGGGGISARIASVNKEWNKKMSKIIFFMYEIKY